MSTPQNNTLLDILRHIVDGLEKKSRNEMTMASMKLLAMIGEPAKKGDTQVIQTTLPLPSKRVVAPKVVRINGELLAAMLELIYKEMLTNSHEFSPEDFYNSVKHHYAMNTTLNAVDYFLRLMYQNKILVRVGNGYTYSLTEPFYQLAKWQDDGDNFERYFEKIYDRDRGIFITANLFGVIALYVNNHRHRPVNISKLLLYIMKEHPSYYENYHDNNMASMEVSIKKCLEYYFMPINLV